MALVDVTDDAVLLLRAIEGTRGKFGLNLPIDVLLGKRHARIAGQGFDKLEVHGAGRHKPEEHWKVIGKSLVQELLVDGRSAGGKGYGKRGTQVTVYSVSSLGKRLLQGEGSRVHCDIVAEAVAADVDRARRSARATKRKSAVPTTAKGSPTPAQLEGQSLPSPEATPGTGAVDPLWKRRKLPQSIAKRSSAATPKVSGSAQAQSGVGIESGFDFSTCSSLLPSALEAALMPFQRIGVAFAMHRGGRVLFGDDMGLGKTIQAIATCCVFRQDWPVLVVVPNSVRMVWAEELERWIPDLGVGGVNAVKNGDDVAGLTECTAAFHIVSYGIIGRASKVRDYIRSSSPFRMIIVDESHMIKNRVALRTREIMQIVKHCSRVILLSGTPALSRPVELYTQIEAIEPGLFESYSAFTSRYCAPKWTPFGMNFTGASNIDELHDRLKPIMVRRLKADVLSELPDKRRQRVQLEVTWDALSNIATMRDELQSLGEEDELDRHSLLTKMYRESSEAKQGPVCEYVEDLIEAGCKFLVFGHHLAMLDALEATAMRAKAKSIRIDGSVSSSDRLRRVNEFQADDSVRVAILGILAAGVGITLTAATTVVFAELHWTPGVLVQAEDRAHRIGQKSSVNVHYLVARGTIDDIIWPCVSHKVEVLSRMCDGRRDQLVASPLSTDQGLKAAGAGTEGKVGADVGGLVAAMQETPPPPQQAAHSPQSEEKSAPPPSSACSVLSMLKGQRPTRRAKTGKVKSRRTAVSDDVIETIDSTSESEQEEVAKAVDPRYSFCVSRLTGRVHVLVDNRPMGCNFKFADWVAVRDRSAFPGALASDPLAVVATEVFLVEWEALKVREQRQLEGVTMQPPLRTYLRKQTRSRGSDGSSKLTKTRASKKSDSG